MLEPPPVPESPTMPDNVAAKSEPPNVEEDVEVEDAPKLVELSLSYNREEVLPLENASYLEEVAAVEEVVVVAVVELG